MWARAIQGLSLLLLMTVVHCAVVPAVPTGGVIINGTSYYDTYIYRSRQTPLVLACQEAVRRSVVWNSSVTGPISPGAIVSIQGVTITNAGGLLMLDTFIPTLSAIYTCSVNNAVVSSILLTTSNPSLNILSQQPVKLYNDATKFQLLVSSYFIDNGILKPIPVDDISIQYYFAALRENVTALWNATQTLQGPYQLTVFLRDAILPSGTTFFILVDNGNGSKIELAFTLAKIALYLTPIPTEIIALIGDNVTIDCSPSDPAITVSIIISISGNKVQRFISNTHELISVVESNSGNYTCSGSAPSSTTLLADDLILTETVHIIVLPDPVVIQFNGNFVVNVSIININSNNANLTCLGTTGNGRRQWRTYNDSIDSKIRDAYQMLSDGDGAVGVANEQLTIIISANKTMLIIGDVNRYSGSFLYCTSLESGKKAVTLITQANPFVIVHPDLPPDAALGQRFEMMFVVGLNSNGISNQIQISGTGTAEVTLFLNSTVVNTERSLTKLPFSLQYKMPISTVSNGNYTITVQSSFSNKKTVASTFLTVIVPNISVTSSPINVLQSTLVNLSCVPSDKRAPIVWQYFNTSSAMFNDILNESPYSVGYNGYWLSFYTILNPASLQDLNLPSLPNQSLGIIKPSPKLLVPYVQTQGSLSFSCSLVNGSTEKVFSEHIQLNTLRDSVQMVVTFINRSLVSLFNDTTINYEQRSQIAILDCLALSGLGTPTMQRRKAGVDQLLQPGIAVENTSINVSSTQVSISVRAEVINSDEPTFTSDIVGYYKCSVSNGDISIVNIIDYYNLFTNEGSSMIKLPLGSIGIVYFQLAVLCFDGLNNLAFLYEESIVAMLQSYSLNESILITLSQNSTESNIALYVVGPTRLALYINPVTQISGGVYSIMAGGFETVLNASVTLNTTVPVLSVLQPQVQVYQFKTTQISCFPSQDGVQIQWTFLRTNTVVYTGYEHSYTITEASLFDEGTYMCSVYGANDPSIVEPKTVYVNVIAVCPANYTAGVVWNAAFENQTVQMPCTNADPKFSPATQMSQQCLPSGQWAMVDFTKCTLKSGVNEPFTLFWSSLLDEITVRDKLFFNELIPGINITFKIINISSSMFSGSSGSLYGVLLSASWNDQQLMDYYPFMRHKRQAFPSLQLSYATMWPSDPCSCKQGPNNEFYLCSDVLSSPCNCTNSTLCQCVPPFVGDGEFCTLDSDLDTIPDKPLNCTGHTYCVQDNCPYIYNPPIQEIQSDVCSGKLIDGCKPTYDTIWKLQWPSVPVNFTYVQPCPNGQINAVSGKTYRFCSSTGNWGPTDVTQCESYQYKYLAEQVLLSSLEIPQGLGIVTSLFAYTQPQTVSILPLDLKDSVIIISTVLNLLIASRQQGRVTDVKDTVIILDVINNLLNETNLGGWQILQSVYPNTASSLLLSNTESYGLYVASTINTSTSIMLSRSSIVLEASKVQIAPNQADIKFPGGISDLFVNASFSSSDANIVIPGGLLFERANKSSSVPVVNMIIKNINMFLPNNGSISQQVDSLIISSQVAVEDGGFASLVLKTRPVSIIFRINNRNNVTSHYQCSFWNFFNSSWSSDGMLPPSSNGSFVQCNSTHLTSFAVLLAVENFPDSEALTIISYIGCGISMAGLLATIVFFLTFKKKLIEKPHNFIHLNLAIALFLAFLVFVAGVETAKHNEAACKVVAALLQYFWLSAFCWMMCEGVMLYLMLIVVFSSLKDKWWFFFLLGWLPPLLFVVIGLAVRNDYYVVRGKDGKTISYCWMSTSEGTIWAFAAPVVLVLLINVVFLIMVLVVLFKKARPKLTEAKLAKDNRSAVIYLVKSSVILLPVLGCTWIFGLLSVNQYTLVFTWLFTILNSLQGFFIFICYVLRHEKVWGRISKKYASWYTSSQSGESKSKRSNIYTDVKSSITGQNGKGDTHNRSNIYTDVKCSTTDQSENEDTHIRSNVYTDVKSSTTDQSENEDTHISSIMDQSDKGNTDHRSNIFTDVQSSIMDQSGKFIRGGSVYDVVLSKVAVETTHCMDAKVEESVIIECTTFCDTSK